jgi:hypothetical protein
MEILVKGLQLPERDAMGEVRFAVLLTYDYIHDSDICVVIFISTLFCFWATLAAGIHVCGICKGADC